MSKKSRRKQLSDKVSSSKRRDKPIEKKPNPFELKFNKQKHAVAGQRKKAAAGLPLLSRQRGIEQRKRTLLSEYNRFGKANEIVDRRLGERNANLTSDQKMALRFAAERRRRYKVGEKDDSGPSSNFQLTGIDSVLTHRGKALSEIEKLNDRPILDDDEEDDPGFGADFVKLAHFGGGNEKGRGDGNEEEANGDKKKSRKELIEEMIANSKRARYEKQMQREKAMDLTAELDDQWKAALKDNLVAQWIRTDKDDDDDHHHHHHHHEKEKTQEATASKQSQKKAEEKLDYDRLVHEMTFEPKAAVGVEKLKKKNGEAEEPADKERDASESAEPEKVHSKKSSRSYITGDDDIPDFQRFKKEKEKPFIVQYDKQGRLINGEAVTADQPSPPPVKKPKLQPGIEFLEPRIETNFNPEKKKKRTAKGESGERQKLVQKYKKELRGTIRELRKDNEFLARQQHTEQQQQDSERRRKVKNLMKSLVSQETECKKWKKKKS